MIIGIIVARGGSKGVPRKNIVNFCGKPLVAWTIEQAIECPMIDEVYVSTEDSEIAKISKKYGAKVIIRPKEFAKDDSPVELALKHALEQINNLDKINYVVLFQPSSPLKETFDITNAIRKIISENADSLFSGTTMDDLTTWTIKDGKLESFSFDWKNRGMRTDRVKKIPQIIENGAIYIFKPSVLYEYNNRLGGKIVMSEMDSWKIHEIDNMDDLKLCSELFTLKILKNGK